MGGEIQICVHFSFRLWSLSGQLNSRNILSGRVKKHLFKVLYSIKREDVILVMSGVHIQCSCLEHVLPKQIHQLPYTQLLLMFV